jgi:hypothetical protein
MSVTVYLIVRPRGTLLWDSGTVPDALVKPEGITVARATVKKHWWASWPSEHACGIGRFS